MNIEDCQMNIEDGHIMFNFAKAFATEQIFMLHSLLQLKHFSNFAFVARAELPKMSRILTGAPLFLKICSKVLSHLSPLLVFGWFSAGVQLVSAWCPFCWWAAPGRSSAALGCSRLLPPLALTYLPGLIG